MIKRLAILFALLLVSATANAVDYYVANTAAGSGTGLTYADRMSIDSFNALTGTYAGDTFYFSGTISTTITPLISGSAGSPVILDGWEGGSCDPVTATCSSSAIVSAQAATSSGWSGLRIVGNSHLTIQDFRFINYYPANGSPTSGNGIISSVTEGVATPTYITIRRNHVEGYLSGIYFYTNLYTYLGGSYITIEDNVILDSALWYTDSGECAVRLVSVLDTIVRRNHIYNNADKPILNSGPDGIMIYQSRRVLVEYNRIHYMGEDGIDVKSHRHGTQIHGDIIIRYNIFYDFLQTALTLQFNGGQNAYVYGNYFHGSGTTGITWNPILVYRAFKDVAIWSNILIDAESSGVSFAEQTLDGISYAADSGIIHNNTIVNNNQSNLWSRAGVSLLCRASGNYDLKNNIFTDNSVLNTGPTLGHITTMSGYGGVGNYTDEDYNLFWNVGRNSFVYWNASSSTGYYNLSDANVGPLNGLVAYREVTGNGANSIIADPLFVDYANRDLRLTALSPAVGAGVELTNPTWWDVPTIQGVSYSNTVRLDMALHPDTDWTTTIPDVVMTTRQVGAWDLGAYAYGEYVAPPAPEIDFPSTSILDAFTGTGVIGTDWNMIQGTYSRSSDQMIVEGAYNMGLWGGSGPFAETEVYVTVVTLSTSSFGLTFRSNEAWDTFYYLWITDNGDGTQRGTVRYKVDGQSSIIVGNEFTLSLADGHKIGVRMIDSTISVWTDDGTGWELEGERTDTNLLSGYIGIDCNNTNMVFDDFGGGSATTFPYFGVYDNFNRTDGAIGGVWSATNLEIDTNVVVVTATETSGTAFLPTIYTDAEAYLTVPTIGADENVAIYLRRSATDWYEVLFNNASVPAQTNLAITRYHTSGAGSAALATATLASFTGGEKVGARIEGTTIDVYVDSGSGWVKVLTDTDANIASGQIGFGLFDDAAASTPTITADDFGGGWVPVPVLLDVIAEVNFLVSANVNLMTSHAVNWMYPPVAGVVPPPAEPACTTVEATYADSGAMTLNIGQYSGSRLRGQRFTFGGTTGRQICKIGMQLAYVGSASHIYQARIYTDSSNAPGSLIGQSDNEELNAIGTSKVEIVFDLSTPSSAMTNGTAYWIVLYTSTSQSSNYAKWYRYDAGVSGKILYSSDGSSWVVSDSDNHFEFSLISTGE